MASVAARWDLRTVVATALLAGCASTAYRKPLVGADRPGYTFVAATTPAGVVESEVGYTDSRFATLTYQTLGEGLVRIGVGPNTELRLFGNSFALRTVDGRRDVGMEDAKIGVKQRLWAGRDSTGLGAASIAVLPAISIPTGSSGFGAGTWQPELLVAATLPLSTAFSLVSDVGDAYVKVGDGRSHRLVVTLAGWKALTTKLSAFVEYAGFQLADDRSTRLHDIDAGIAIMPLPAIQLDLRAGHGMNGVRHDAFFGAGIARRW